MPATPPPDIPANLAATPGLADYLRRLATWAYQEHQKAIRKDEATAHLLLASQPAKGGSPVYSIGVDHTGALTITSVPLGGGQP